MYVFGVVCACVVFLLMCECVYLHERDVAADNPPHIDVVAATIETERMERDCAVVADVVAPPYDVAAHLVFVAAIGAALCCACTIERERERE